MKNVLRLFMILCIALAGTAVFAQDIQTKGSVSGQVTDASGGAVTGATVKITGGSVERTATTNEEGLYTFDNLNPGTYKVRVEMTNFKGGEVSDVTVFVGKTATTNVTLQAGNISETVTVTAGADLDQTSTAVGSNLNDQLFENIPVARGVAGLFYLAPGTTDSLGGGRDNPSISGGSALDNLYVADGVNITDSAFGGIGTFSRSYGALGTGINTAFVKEVQVKTGGFEPQYGQATGGIINIITQSGGNEFHGAAYGYAKPGFLEARRKQRDDFTTNKVGELLNAEQFDAGFDMGGPIVKNKLFFFGSVNPTLRRDQVIGAVGSGLRTISGQHNQDYKSWNYAGKVDWNLNSNHTLAFSIYGDPTKTNKSSFATLNIDNTTANSQLDYGSRNVALRYNGSLTPTWTLNASFSQANNHFDEFGFDDFNSILDRTGVGVSSGATRGFFNAIGRGFIEPTEGKTRRFSADTNKQFSFLGQHSVGVGYQFSRANYSGLRDRSGPHYTIPAVNEAGASITTLTGAAGAAAIGQPINVAWSLRPHSNTNPNACPSCPIFRVPGATDIGLGPGNRRVYLRQDRGEYGDPIFDTKSDYHAAYVQDTWRLNKYLTAVLGFRNEQERVFGSPSATGDVAAYSFTGNWAPRVGFTVDPTGQGKMKAYYNYGRYFEYLPLDLAERSLSSEQSFIGGRFAPQFTTCTINGLPDRCAVINSFGTVNPVYAGSHLLNGSPTGSGAGIGISFNDPHNPILSGTKLGFIREHVIGFEAQLPKNLVFSARYLDRKQPRIVEDAAVVSVEQFNEGLFGQTYFLANIDSRFDRVINPIPFTYTPGGAHPAGCGPVDEDGHTLFDIPEVHDANGNVIGAVCFAPNPLAGEFGVDGLPDGFPDPVHNYRAVEIELNKRFADNWQLLSNWRIASLKGNYEGHLRNDNGQTDPGISSLFDFVQGEFNLLGDQFAVGPLNTDRRHVINVYGSYAFSQNNVPSLRGLNLGFGWHGESGIPISEYLAHPGYLNAGEIPVGGRGKLGRTEFYMRFDAHADYTWNLTEKYKLKFIGDFFNVLNSTRIRQPQEFKEASAGVLNVDFLKPRSFHAPFNMRLGLRFEF